MVFSHHDSVGLIRVHGQHRRWPATVALVRNLFRFAGRNVHPLIVAALQRAFLEPLTLVG